MKLKHLLSFLDDAVYFAEENNSEVSKTRLDDFSAYYLTLPSELMDDLDLRKLLSDYIYQLSIFDSGDKVYEVSKSLRDREFSSGDKLATVKMFWLDAYKATNLGNFKVEEAISNYYGYLQQIFKAKENIKNYKKFVIYQNQLIDNLLLKYPMFYREGYFSIKNSLEKELISLYAAGQAREELIRELINNKITFLQRLRYFFFKDEVEVTDAKNVMSRLIEEIDLLMDAQSSKVAVQTLFEAEMEDIGNLWGYLNTPEYYSSKSYGATHEDRYKAYVAEKAKIWSFVDVQRDVLGEEAAPEITKADVVKEIEEKFVEYAEITNVKVVNLEDPTSRFVDIEAVVGGYPFTATYDREYGTLKQVKSYDELIAKDSLKISGLLTLVQEKLQGREDLAVPEEFNEETNAERVARVYIVTKLNEAGFEASLANVEVINKDEYWYRVSDVYIKDNESTKASFDYIANSEKAKNLYLLMDKKPILVDGEYSLEEVKGVILGEKEYEVKKVGRTKAS